MDLKVFEAAITDKVKAEAALATATAQVTDLTTKLDAATTRVTELEAAQPTGTAELQAKVDAAAPALAFIADAAKAAMTAKGETGDVPAKLEDQIALIKATSTALHQIPLDGKGKPATESQDTSKADFSAFKTR